MIHIDGVSSSTARTANHDYEDQDIGSDKLNCFQFSKIVTCFKEPLSQTIFDCFRQLIRSNDEIHFTTSKVIPHTKSRSESEGE